MYLYLQYYCICFSISDLHMPTNELIRMVRVYSTPWEEKSAALQKLHEDHETKVGQLNVALRQLCLQETEVSTKDYDPHTRQTDLLYVSRQFLFRHFLFLHSLSSTGQAARQGTSNQQLGTPFFESTKPKRTRSTMEISDVRLQTEGRDGVGFIWRLWLFGELC